MSQGEAFQVGLRIGKYELTRKLGEGGFGVLFAARDTALDRDLAIKFLHPHHSSNTEVVKRFVQEARSIAKVVHPGVVTVYESGEVWGTGTPADGAAFIIMELLNGETLTQRMKSSGGRLAPATAMEICRQVASALEAAHRQGVVHRDLKPDNVMLVKDLALTLGERAKVLDFGIAKLATATPSSGATMAGMVFGTPNYMSPEQCRSAADANHSSDIYSLGCILFELVTGRAPFEGGMAELIAHHILTPPPVPSTIIPGLPPHIDDVVSAMLAKDPQNRPASMTVVEAILEERRLVATPSAQKSGARTRTLGGARLATNPPPNFGKPMAPGERPHIPGVTPPAVSPPDSGPVRTAATAPAAVAVPQTPATGSPTTLSSAAGIAAKLDRKSSSKWWIAIPIVAIAAVGTVLAVSRGGGSASGANPEGSASSLTTAGSAEIAHGSATTPTTGSAETGSATTATAGSAATGSAATGSAATISTNATTTAGSAATATTGTTAGSAMTATTAGSAATGTTTGSAATTTKTTGTTTGSAATITTKTTGTTTGSAATITKTAGTTTGSAATTTKTTGTTTGSAATITKTAGTTTKTTGTTTKTTGTTTKTTGTTAGSASKPPIKTTTPPGTGSAAKKCQGRSCILDGDF